MDRRAFLTGTGVALTFSLVGCLGTAEDSIESFSLSEPTVEQGETAIIDIEAPNLTGLHISEAPDEFPSELLSLGEAVFTPDPDTVWTTLPPHWDFSGEDVVGEVPIETSPKTPTGTYRFVFHARVEREDDPRNIPTTITIETAPK